MWFRGREKSGEGRHSDTGGGGDFQKEATLWLLEYNNIHANEVIKLMYNTWLGERGATWALRGRALLLSLPGQVLWVLWKLYHLSLHLLQTGLMLL